VRAYVQGEANLAAADYALVIRQGR